MRATHAEPSSGGPSLSSRVTKRSICDLGRRSSRNDGSRACEICEARKGLSVSWVKRSVCMLKKDKRAVPIQQGTTKKSFVSVNSSSVESGGKEEDGDNESN